MNTTIEEKPLSMVEEARLTELEQTIKVNFLGFVKVGNALAEIRDQRLYRNGDGRTFEAYCRELWDMCRNHANKLIRAASVIENLGTIVPKTGGNTPESLPANEAQARELAKLTPEDQRQVWRKIIENEEKPTARIVKAAVWNHTGEKLEKQVRKSGDGLRKNSEEKVSAEFAEKWESFFEQVRKERAENWRQTSKKNVVKNLQTITGILLDDLEAETAAPACAMDITDREKLLKAGFRIFRIRPNKQVIEEFNEDIGWMVAVTSSNKDELSNSFEELMEDPKNLRA